MASRESHPFTGASCAQSTSPRRTSFHAVSCDGYPRVCVEGFRASDSKCRALRTQVWQRLGDRRLCWTAATVALHQPAPWAILRGAAGVTHSACAGSGYVSFSWWRQLAWRTAPHSAFRRRVVRLRADGRCLEAQQHAWPGASSACACTCQRLPSGHVFGTRRHWFRSMRRRRGVCPTSLIFPDVFHM